MSMPPRANSHGISRPAPRWIIVHATGDIFLPGAGAHAFGPFDSEQDAQDFHNAGDPGDHCLKVMLVVVGPHPRDMIATEDLDGHVPPH